MAPPMAPTPIILDCDPGHDDALAILLAAAHPAVDLRAITTVAGNQTLDKTTLNARRICTAAGIDDVPIVAGCDQPLAQPLHVAADIHGDSGLDGPTFGPPTVAATEGHAVEFMADLFATSTVPITLVAVGPLTNVATLVQRHPGVVDAIEQVVIMGGSTDRGNTTPLAEFNIWVDPEAAAVVADADVVTTWHGLNITHQATATPEVIERIAALDTLLATTVVKLLQFFATTYRREFGLADPPVHDPVAVAHVIDPTITTCATAGMRIELDGTHTRGATVVDLHGVTDWPTTRVGRHLDADRFWDLMVAAIAQLGRPA